MNTDTLIAHQMAAWTWTSKLYAKKKLTRDRIVGNEQILQWDLMSKINIFAELRQKVCLYIHVLVLQRGLPILDGKLERLVTKKSWKSGCQTRVRQTIAHRLVMVKEKTEICNWQSNSPWTMFNIYRTWTIDETIYHSPLACQWHSIILGLIHGGHCLVWNPLILPRAGVCCKAYM